MHTFIFPKSRHLLNFCNCCRLIISPMRSLVRTRIPSKRSTAAVVLSRSPTSSSVVASLKRINHLLINKKYQMTKRILLLYDYKIMTNTKILRSNNGYRINRCIGQSKYALKGNLAISNGFPDPAREEFLNKSVTSVL